MSSFRKFGGIDRSAHNNIVRSHLSNNIHSNIINSSGQTNSKEVFNSNIDLNGNSLMQTNCIYFQDGTVQCSAGVENNAVANSLTISPNGSQYTQLINEYGTGSYTSNAGKNATQIDIGGGNSGYAIGGNIYVIPNTVPPFLGQSASYLVNLEFWEPTSGVFGTMSANIIFFPPNFTESLQTTIFQDNTAFPTSFPLSTTPAWFLNFSVNGWPGTATYPPYMTINIASNQSFILFTVPDSTYQWSYNIRCLDQSSLESVGENWRIKI
jgi:hypothetical protein